MNNKFNKQTLLFDEKEVNEKLSKSLDILLQYINSGKNITFYDDDDGYFRQLKPV